MIEDDIKETEKAIELAKKELKKGPYEYVKSANYILRECPVVRKTEHLSDLSWTYDKDVNLHKNDVLFLIELIEKEINKVWKNIEMTEKCQLDISDLRHLINNKIVSIDARESKLLLKLENGKEIMIHIGLGPGYCPVSHLESDCFDDR